LQDHVARNKATEYSVSLSPAPGLFNIMASVSKSVYYVLFPTWVFLVLSVSETTTNWERQKHSLDPPFKNRTRYVKSIKSTLDIFLTREFKSHKEPPLCATQKNYLISI